MNTPYWQATVEPPSYPPLSRDLDVEAIVVGGGITGVTTAYLLRKAGLRVALFERDRIGSGESSHTTAHLTYMTDTRLSDLMATFGDEKAKLAWEAGRDAMDFIRHTANDLDLDCDLRVVPGYLALAEDADPNSERDALRREAEAAKKMGFDVVFLESAPPDSRPAIEFRDQLKFHPLRYLIGLAAKAGELGVAIHEQSKVGFSDNGKAIVNGHTVTYQSAVIATHVPMQGNKGTLGAALFQTKIAGYSTYAIAAEVPSSDLEEMIWSDTADPFLYLRVEKRERGSLLILGGEDHKTGQEDHTETEFRNLEKAMHRFAPDFKITHRWSGQVIETVDGLPYIGMDGSGQYISTGFSGNGYTFGTLAALMARDVLTRVENRYTDLFDPDRKTFSVLGEYLGENKDFPIRLVTDRIGSLPEDPAQLECGCGQVMKIDGQRGAVYRDENGQLHTLTAVCPHLGCIVMWNEAEQTWDCPCHGSRFTGTGQLIAGPAEKGLDPLEIRK